MDDQIPTKAKKAKEKHKSKSKKSKKKRQPTDDDGSIDNSTKPSSDDLANAVSERKKERITHNLASSGLPKQPPEIEYNLDPIEPAKKEKKKKKKHSSGDDLKSPPEDSTARFIVERTKAAPVPGARQARSEDMSDAERLKYGYNNSVSGNSNAAAVAAASIPGAKQERADDMSPAERLKYGDHKYKSMHLTPGAVVETEHDIDAAARLKFQDIAKTDSRRNITPGVVQGNNTNTSEAERLKFGLARQFLTEGGGNIDENNDSSDASYDEEEGSAVANADENAEFMEHSAVESNYSIVNPRKETNQRQDSATTTMYSKRLIDTLRRSTSFMSDNAHGDDSGHEKREIETWKALFQICSCISFIIIIALAASLGVANKKAAAAGLPAVAPSPPDNAIAVADTPTVSPRFDPTNVSEEYNICSETNEVALLNNPRYTSIRSELVLSGISTSQEFSDGSSYQRKALCWLTFGDRLSINSTDPFLNQRYALATVYFGMNEPQVLLDKGWLSGKSECQWKPMVSCDNRTDSTVTRLALYGNDLRGTFPKELNYLQDTTYLDVSLNRLQGSVFDAIGSWKKLISLRLSSNKFTDIPDLSMFPVLKHFDIHDNKLEGPIPEVLATYSSLVYLDISTNAFGETIPTVLGELQSLEALYIHLNDVVGTMPEEICALRSDKLTHLSVDCLPPGPEVECPNSCCTFCNYYDTGNNPFT